MIYDLIIIFLVAGFILERILDYLNIRNWKTTVPATVKEIYDEERYRKAREYAVANYRFDLIFSLFNMLLILLFLISGAFGRIDVLVRLVSVNPIIVAILFFAVLGILSELLTLPFSVYRTFVLEEKFGFNKTTVKTFILDKLKGYVVSLLVGGVLISLLVIAYRWMGDDFWWIAWIMLSSLMILATMFFATL